MGKDMNELYNQDILKSLSEDERAIALSILKELGESGESSTYNDLIFSDYNEIPVDIETFLTDDNYLGKAWKDVSGKSKLYPFWLDTLKKIFPNNFDTQYNTLLETGARGVGKAQPLYSKLFSKDGYITMGDVTVGTELYGDDGKLHKVTNIFPQGKKKVYELTFSDGSKCRCSDEHLWTVYQKYNHNREVTLTLNEIMKIGLFSKPIKRGWVASRFAIPMVNPICFKEREVFIDPYLMGILIGDGALSTGEPRFTSFDQQIVDIIESIVNKNGYTLSNCEHSYNIRNIDLSHKGLINNINKYKDEIKRYGLNVKSEVKFIPKDYLFNSVENRIALLQGLLDSDGFIDKKGYILFDTVSTQLKDDIIFLVQSLGGEAPYRVKKGKYMKDDVLIECKDCYNISINLPNKFTLFRLDRKLERVNKNKKEPFRTIKNIDFIGEEECQCILLDSDRHLYLTDNLIVTHNSEVACGAVGTYLLYRIMCLKHPLEFYHLKPTEKIVFAFMNIKKELSEAIAMDKFQKTIQLSPWFMSRGTMTQRNNAPYWNPPDPLEIIIGSQADDVIGQPIAFAFFDEISFIRNQDIDKQKQKAKNMIDTAIGGMMTRFIHNGKNPTMLVVASSKRSEQSFMEEYIKLLSTNESNNTYIVDKPVWEVKPKGTYSDKTFFIALGNKFLESVVVPQQDEDKLNVYKEKGYHIIEAPIDFRAKALEDLERMLCDYAGISSASSNKYLSASRINDTIKDEFKNPFPDIIETGNGVDDVAQYSNFFNMDNVPKELMNKPLFVHLDMSISGDMTGIAGTWIVGKKPTSEGNPSKDLFYRLAFSTSIKAPKGRQISFEKNRNFIRWLKEVGFKVKEVTSDTFQSYDLQQQLKAEGFNCSILSVDRVDTDHINKPYQYLKSTIYEQRIEMYRSERLFDEMVQIERSNETGKVDHPPNCFTGDTEIQLLDGRNISLVELQKEHNEGKTNYVYTMNEHTHKIEPNKVLNVWCSGKTNKLCIITLDNDEVIKCTPEHLFMLRNGEYIQAQDLLPNDSLMPLYTKISDKGLRGYRLFYEPFEDKWHYEHRRFATQILDEKYLVHHIDCNKLNNSPNNLLWMSKQKHVEVHANSGTGAYSIDANEKRRESVKKWHENNRETSSYKERNLKLSLSSKNHHLKDDANFKNKNELKHQKTLDKIKTYFDNVDVETLDSSQILSYCIKIQHIEGKHTNYENAHLHAIPELRKSNEHIKMLKKLFPDVDKETFYSIFGFDFDTIEARKRAQWVNRYRKYLYELHNHSVKKIEFVDVNDVEVYDIEVENNHNFALHSGVFVHNSHKDALDAVCGSVFTASKYAEEFAFDYGENLQQIVEINEDKETNTLEQMRLNFEEELRKLGPQINLPQKDSSGGEPVYLMYDDILIY